MALTQEQAIRVERVPGLEGEPLVDHARPGDQRAPHEDAADAGLRTFRDGVGHPDLAVLARRFDPDLGALRADSVVEPSNGAGALVRALRIPDAAARERHRGQDLIRLDEAGPLHADGAHAQTRTLDDRDGDGGLGPIVAPAHAGGPHHGVRESLRAQIGLQGANVGLEEIGAKRGGEPAARAQLHAFEQRTRRNLQIAREIDLLDEGARPLADVELDEPGAVALLQGAAGLDEGVAALAVRGLDGASGRVHDERVDGATVGEPKAARQRPRAQGLVAAELDLVAGSLGNLELDAHLVRGRIPREGRGVHAGVEEILAVEKRPHGLHAVTHRPLAIAVALGETKGATDLSGGHLPRSLDADEPQTGRPAGRDNHGQAAPVRGRLRRRSVAPPGRP